MRILSGCDNQFNLSEMLSISRSMTKWTTSKNGYRIQFPSMLRDFDVLLQATVKMIRLPIRTMFYMDPQTAA